MAYRSPDSGKQADPLPTALKVSWNPVLEASEKGNGPTRTMIIGMAGFGKTRLAATWPNPLILDYDNGGGSARVPRIVMPRDNTAIRALDEFSEYAEHGKVVDGKWTHKLPNGNEVSYNTIVIDTVDVCQQAAKPFLLGDRLQMERQDWGKLLQWMRPPIERLLMLPVHIVFVAHQATVQPVRWDDHGYIGPAIQGALKEALIGMCNVVMNIIMDGSGGRRIYVRPSVTVIAKKTYDVVAKDQHDWFKNAKGVATNGCFTVPNEPSGYPSNRYANWICSHGTSAEELPLLENTKEPEPQPIEEQPEE